MTKHTIRDFHSVNQLDGGKTYQDLPILFEGTMADCHNFCEKTKGFKWWHAPDLIFGGYYVDNDGKCLMIV